MIAELLRVMFLLSEPNADRIQIRLGFPSRRDVDQRQHVRVVEHSGRPFRRVRLSAQKLFEHESPGFDLSRLNLSNLSGFRNIPVHRESLIQTSPGPTAPFEYFGLGTALNSERGIARD